MGITFWLFVFVGSLIVLVKSADYFTKSSEKIALLLGISPFIIGVTIVGIGTSLPELASSLAAVFKESSEIVVANALGSNIANIFLITGLAAFFARHLIVERDLIDVDLPLLAISSFFVLMILLDGKVTFIEGIVSLCVYGIYLAYTIFAPRQERAIQEVKEEIAEKKEALEIAVSKYKKLFKKTAKAIAKFELQTIGILLLSVLGLYIGANYTIESLLQLSGFFNLSASVIAITAVAVGTSLPELVVSVVAAMKKKYEIALGNIFGSNIFNALVVVGAPALVSTLKVDEITFQIGIPFFIGATVLFVISGISKRIHFWEGAMYLFLYLLFVLKMFGLF